MVLKLLATRIFLVNERDHTPGQALHPEPLIRLPFRGKPRGIKPCFPCAHSGLNKFTPLISLGNKTDPEFIDFFKSAYKCNYLPRTRNRIPNWESIEIFNQTYYKKNRREFNKLTKKFSSLILDEKIASVSIGKCSFGFGLFADKLIKKKQFIGEYTGYLQTGKGGSYCWDYPPIEGIDNVELSALCAGNETRFINHSFKANCIAEHLPIDNIYTIIILVKKNIYPGQQLFLDYGDNFWSGKDEEIIIEH